MRSHTSYELLLVHHRLDRHLLGRPNVGRVLVNGAEHHRGRGRVFRGGHGPEVVAATKQCELVDHRADFGILDLVRGPALQVLFVKEGTVKIEEKLGDLARSADVEEALAILRWGTGRGLRGGGGGTGPFIVRSGVREEAGCERGPLSETTVAARGAVD